MSDDMNDEDELDETLDEGEGDDDEEDGAGDEVVRSEDRLRERDLRGGAGETEHVGDEVRLGVHQ